MEYGNVSYIKCERNVPVKCVILKDIENGFHLLMTCPTFNDNREIYFTMLQRETSLSNEYGRRKITFTEKMCQKANKMYILLLENTKSILYN